MSGMGVIKQTVDSSAELIKGMMVFSRKTPAELQPIELNKLVAQTGSHADPIHAQNDRNRSFIG